MKRYFKAFGYLLSVHVLALLVMTLFRLVEFIALHGMIVDAEASRVMAFVKGVWFDNVIACYISVLPVAVLLIAASLGGGVIAVCCVASTSGMRHGLPSPSCLRQPILLISSISSRTSIPAYSGGSAM